MARLITGALERGGHSVSLLSRFQSWSANPDDFADLAAQGRKEVDRILHSNTGLDAILTYHLYHKAPDFIGPALSKSLSIPYVIIEASRALKRKHGPWAAHFNAVDEALTFADQVCALHSADSEGLRAVVPPGQLTGLFPFLETGKFPEKPRYRENDPTRLLAVGMMREGDKEASYRLLAQSLLKVDRSDWRLSIVGDGPVRSSIEKEFTELPVEFLGAVNREELITIYHQSDILVWPAINEAFGMVFLEAQSCGLPVVGARVGGVPDIAVDGVTGLLARYEDGASFAEKLSTLLNNRERMIEMGKDAARYVRTWHDIDLASHSLSAILDRATAIRGARI